MAIGYTEMASAVFTAGANASWEDYDIFTNLSVPKGAVAEILIGNNLPSQEREAGVRTDGSGLARKLDLSEAEAGGLTWFSMLVQVHATTGLIELYAEIDADIEFRCIGYFTGCTFTEDIQNWSNVAGGWEDKDLFTDYGVPKERVVQIVAVNPFSAWEEDIGVRTDGSALARTTWISEAEGGGVNPLSFIVKTDADGEIESNSNHGNDAYYYVGYFDAGVDFTEAWTSYAPAGDAGWENEDLTGDAIPPPANGIVYFALTHHDIADETECGIRSVGSGLDRKYDEREAEGGGTHDAKSGFSATVNVDASKILRVYCEDADEADFFYQGYFSVGAAPSQETKTFTADAVLLKETDKTLTADAILVDRPSKTFTADSVLVDRLSKTYSADALLLKTIDKTFTADAALLKTLLKTLTGDAVLVDREAKTFTADAVLVDRLSKTLTADAVLVDREIKTFTADASLLKTLDKTFTADAILVDRLSKTFTADAVLVDRLSKTLTGDATLVDRLAKTYTVDAVLLKTIDKTFTADAVIILAGAETKTFTADAVLIKTIDKTFTADAILVNRPSKTLTGDSVLVDRLSKTYTIDAVLLKTIDKTFTADAVVVDRLLKTFTADASLLQTLEKTYTADSTLVDRLIKTFTSDAILVNRLSKTYTADAILLKTLSKLYTADAVVISRLEETFTADSVVVDRLTESFTADALIVDRLAKTFSADAVLSTVYLKTFTADAVLKWITDIVSGPELEIKFFEAKELTMSLGMETEVKLFPAKSETVDIDTEELIFNIVNVSIDIEVDKE